MQALLRAGAAVHRALCATVAGVRAFALVFFPPPQGAAKVSPMSAVLVSSPFVRLLADGFVLVTIKNSNAATQAAHATFWTGFANFAMAVNSGNATAAQAAASALAASITDPATLDAISQGESLLANYTTLITGFLSKTVLGSALGTLDNSFWTQVVALAAKYLPAAPTTTATLPAAPSTPAS